MKLSVNGTHTLGKFAAFESSQLSVNICTSKVFSRWVGEIYLT